MRKNRYLAVKKVMEEKKKEMEKQMELQAVECGDGGGGHQNGGYHSRRNSVRNTKYEPRFHREVNIHISYRNNLLINQRNMELDE